MAVTCYHEGSVLVSVITRGFITDKEFAIKTGISKRMIQNDRREKKFFKPEQIRWLETKRKKPTLLIQEDQVKPYKAFKGPTPRGRPAGFTKDDPYRENDQADGDDAPTGESVSMRKARAAADNEEYKAQRTKIELMKARNELLPVEQVEELISDIFITVRQSLLSVTPRVAPKVVGITDVTKISEEIDKEILSILDELAKVKRVTGKKTPGG